MTVFKKVRSSLADRRLNTEAETFTLLAELMSRATDRVFYFVVVDETQDVSIPQLKFLAAMAGPRSKALFFARDLGQRVISTALLVEIAGCGHPRKIEDAEN